MTALTPEDCGVTEDRSEPGTFRDAMRHWATGVAIVTTQGSRGPHGMTANSLLSVSLDPPTLLVSLKRGSRTMAVIQETGHFTVNILTTGQRALAEHFTRRRAPGAEGFAGVGHRPSPHGAGPELEGSAAILTCRRTGEVEVADHTLIIAGVTGVRLPCADGSRAPLLYLHRRYGTPTAEGDGDDPAAACGRSREG